MDCGGGGGFLGLTSPPTPIIYLPLSFVFFLMLEVHQQKAQGTN
jgi:hypothetical protein